MKFDGMLCLFLFLGGVCSLPKRASAELHKPCFMRVRLGYAVSHYFWYLGLLIQLMCTHKSS